MEKVGLILDIDDTLAETALSCIERIKEKYHHNLTAEEIVEKHFQPGNVPEWGGDELQKEIARILNDKDFLLNLPPVVAARSSIEKISQKFPVLFYLTSRVPDFLDVTFEWLKKNGFPEVKIVTREPSVVNPQWKIKYLIQSKLDQNIFIDDNPDAFRLFDEKFKGKPILLQRYPLSGKFSKKVNIIKGWEDIASFLLPSS